MDKDKVQLVLKEASNYDVVCLFGFDEREISEEGSLKEKSLVFFRPSKGFFYEGDGLAFHEIDCDENQCDLTAFQEVCREKIFQSFFYAIHPEVKGAAHEATYFWLEKCQMVQWQCHLAASDYQDFGLQVFENTIRNRERVIDLGSFHKLKNSLKGIPAFICGAGPSLDEAMEAFKLKSTYNRGVFFAGGAALGCLTKAGVSVHITTGIDPDPSYERVLLQGSFEAPFFCQSRFSSSLLDTVQGPIFQVPSNPGYKFEQWMDAGEVFDGGWTVSTFSLALAIHFGCNPIVLVGMDLSYLVDSSTYADGLSKEEEGLKWEDPVSGPLLTQRDWVLAAKWIEEKVKSVPSTSFYTTSPRGLSLDGVRRICLSALLEKELVKSYDIEGFMQVICSSWVESKEIEDKVDLLKKSVEGSLVFLEKLLTLFEKNYPEDPSSKGEFVVNLFDLYDEIAYQEILEPLWQVWQFPIERKFAAPYARDVNRFLFFKKVLQEYGNCLCQ